MPQIKVERIISCSSEDPAYPSENILSTDACKIWRCKTPRERTEKSVFVILQLEKASVITGIDIGNDHSAYVEVLVSRTGMDDEYKSLLVPSSLMNPMESRQSQNTNRVRMFTKDDFSKPERDEKWDRVKIVCLQLFNQHVPFGLSFVKLHTSDSAVSTDNRPRDAALVIRPKSPDVYKPGYLFSKRKELDVDEKLSGAAAIRDSMRNSNTSSPVCKPKLKNNGTPVRMKGDGKTPEDSPKPRNRNELLYSKDEEEPNERIDKLIEKKMEEIKNKEEAEIKKEEAEKKKKEDVHKEKDIKKGSEKKDSHEATSKDKTKNDSGSSKNHHNSTTASISKKNGDSVKERDKHGAAVASKRKSEDTDDRTKKKKAKSTLPKKPFHKLLEGVVFVISGIQNPDRSELRAKALEMGAKYKSDWDNNSTHLICAFVNTPKFNQVKGKGKIVKRNWIEECHSQRKRLPWRRFALDKNDKGDESEEEILEDTSSTLESDDSSDGDARDWSKAVDVSFNKDEKTNSNIYDVDTDEENIVLVK
ncbi:unnamed protein product [Acanthoscelides obtectus]|uniref:BRCT domain-containing protein n=1 Tax=Acanthoscelides obtectus TaxID=200917 RepID=A0A9P0K5A9_ACAOB|nr:unnamed protein product [Acanthoscelides obtectus]CAK1646716.1 DNA repair protein XRCC1 [Acanthoscelides obtectus]